MKITDNHLPAQIFKQLQKYVATTDFKIIDIGANRLISVLEAPDFVLPHIQLENYELITAFLRESYDGFDNQLNIHADNILPKIHYDENKKPFIVNYKVDYASVLYVNNFQGVTLNGTAFYLHEKYQDKLPEDVSDGEYNRMIIEDSNDIKKWKFFKKVPSEPNRFLTYNARLFHSKYPENIDKGVRIVLVGFYSKKDA
ncbi:MAG: hypothetical protein KGZ59_00890 [Chitinophagaceae bacterium]|nr:hypothetical protein [Chitinophagaceae bacterium]